MEDIWKLSRDLNIHSCYYVYREANRIADCLVKKGIGILDSRNWLSNFSKDVAYNSFVQYCGSYPIAFLSLKLIVFPNLRITFMAL